MALGYTGRILRVDLADRRLAIEEPPDTFYRRYFGGRNVVAHYLLSEVPADADPLGPENRLVFAGGVLTGLPFGGSGRNSVGAKSPLTGGYGDAEAGGYWGAALKQAGFDAVVVQGRADRPVYLWIRDGQAELRDARHLWGLPIRESQAALRAELGDRGVRTAQIGPGGESLSRLACVVNDLKHAAGRCGLGAVMGSKRLKAIAVVGRGEPAMAQPERIKATGRWISRAYKDLCWSLHDLGTAGGLLSLNDAGGLPTRNFREGVFEGAVSICGETLRDTILVGRGTCFACPIRCKREVRVEGEHGVDPLYGGPEYETLGALGSNCGVDDLAAIAKANELCNAYTLDTIGVGAAISFAMECFERGLLTTRDTDGLELRFGNAAAVVRLVEQMGRREGFGALLADGVRRAAEQIGGQAPELAMESKGQELPMHEPRFKQGMGLGYAVSITGADHAHNIHDSGYTREVGITSLKGFGILEPLPSEDLSPRKVRLLVEQTKWRSFLNCAVICLKLPYDQERMVDLVNAATGWNTTVYEMMRAGERGMTLARLFNARQGLTLKDDTLPNRCFEPMPSGPLEGQAIDRERFEQGKRLYYGMMGWDAETGYPTAVKLHELDLGWLPEAAL